jgi:membrane protein
VLRDATRLAWRAINRFFDHSGPDRAAAVAYYTLLSFLPMLIFLISLGAVVLGSAERAYAGTLYVLGGVVVHLDERSLAFLWAFVERSLRFQWPGLLLLAWTAKRIFASLFAALAAVFEVPGRGIAKGNLAALVGVFVTGAALLATLLFTTVLAGIEGFVARVAGQVGADVFEGLSGLLLTRILPVAITAAFFFMLYRSVPGRVVGTRHAAIGAGLATVLWEGAKEAFAYYVRTLAHYAGTYGTLEAVIVLALWLELSVSIILLSGEVVALLVGPPAARAAAG